MGSINGQCEDQDQEARWNQEIFTFNDYYMRKLSFIKMLRTVEISFDKNILFPNASSENCTFIICFATGK